jgi:hypothetical protein
MLAHIPYPIQSPLMLQNSSMLCPCLSFSPHPSLSSFLPSFPVIQPLGPCRIPTSALATPSAHAITPSSASLPTFLQISLPFLQKPRPICSFQQFGYVVWGVRRSLSWCRRVGDLRLMERPVWILFVHHRTAHSLEYRYRCQVPHFHSSDGNNCRYQGWEACSSVLEDLWCGAIDHWGEV